MYGYIYITTNLINGRQYIGQKKSPKFLGTKYLGSGKILYQAIDKYGRENFKVELLCECNSKEELNEKEIYYIAKYNAQNDSHFYNISKGGTAGPGGPMFKGGHHSEETKRLMSQNRKGKLNANYGNRWHCSEETKALHSKLSKGVNNGMYGKKHSDETKAKIGAKNKEAMLNRTNITNGIENKYVKSDELNIWLDKGWYIGYTPHITDEFRQKIGKSTSDRRWVTNGIETKYINKEDLDKYLADGWTKGRTYKRTNK